MKGFLAVLMLSLASLVACRKTSQFSAKEISLAGTWKMTEINSNAYWGGPFSWKTIDEDVVVRFTAEGNYYRKPAGQPNYILEGKYEILADNMLKIIASDPQNTRQLDYTIAYYFDGNALILGTGRFETIIQEKFVRF